MSLNWSGKDQKNTNQPASAGQKRSRSDCGNKVTVVLGAQWGDEGKGKVVDLLATEADLVCRCQVNGWSSVHGVGVPFFFYIDCLFSYDDINWKEIKMESVADCWGAKGAQG